MRNVLLANVLIGSLAISCASLSNPETKAKIAEGGKQFALCNAFADLPQIGRYVADNLSKPDWQNSAVYLGSVLSANALKCGIEFVASLQTRSEVSFSPTASGELRAYVPKCDYSTVRGRAACIAVSIDGDKTVVTVKDEPKPITPDLASPPDMAKPCIPPQTGTTIPDGGQCPVSELMNKLGCPTGSCDG